MTLSSTVTFSVALIIIFPAFASTEAESAAIPALSLLKPNSPASSFRLRLLMVILPPPVPLTSTSAALLKVISALATSSGKFKLPSSLIPTVPASDKPPNSMFPPLAVASPASKLISPPTKVRFFPGATSKPTKSPALFSTNERLTISPGLSLKPKPMGILTSNNGGACGLLALNSISPSNNKLSVVLAKNEPPRLSLAFSPKIIPLGLIRNKLAAPLALIKPSIDEILLPVTRLKMLAISLALLNTAEPNVGTENSSKL